MVHSVPIILIAGKAGSGKDTVGKMIATNYNGICLGQADPMKKFAKDVFQFTEDELWGASDLRNAPVSFSEPEREEVSSRFVAAEGLFRGGILEGDEIDGSRRLLWNWFHNMLDVMKSTGQLTPRHALQQLGTEWGRKVNPEMWNRYSIKTCKTLLAGDKTYYRDRGLVDSLGRTYDYAIITDGRFANEILNVRYQGGVSLRIDRPGTAFVGAHSSEKELENIPRHFFSDVLDNSGPLNQLARIVQNTMTEAFDDQRSISPTSYMVSR